MQGYNKGSLGPFMLFHYNRKVDASMKGYSKGSAGTVILV
jgi:hypothetical protein